MSCGIVARSWLLIFTIFFLFVFAQENISYENKKFVFIFLLTKRCDRIFCSLMIQRVQILLLSNVNRNTWTAATISRSRDETRTRENNFYRFSRKSDKYAANGFSHSSACAFTDCRRYKAHKHSESLLIYFFLFYPSARRKRDKIRPHKSWLDAIKMRPPKSLSLSLTCRCIFKQINHFSPRISFEKTDVFEASVKAIILLLTTPDR